MQVVLEQAPGRTAWDDRVASLIDLAAFDRAQLSKEPYDTLTVPGFLRPGGLAAVNQDYPAIAGPTTHDVHELPAGPTFRELVAYLESDEFRARISGKFAFDLEGTARMATVRKYAESSDGAIHTDSKTKVLTVLIYFNETWTQEGGRLRVLRSGTDMNDFAAEVMPTGGTLFAFRRCDWSWHGFPPCAGERRSFQMHFVAGKRAERGYQHKDSISKRVKRFLKQLTRR